MSTHITWSIEKNGRCPKCQGETLLAVCFGEMKVAEGDPDTFQNRFYELQETVTVDEEISGHYCPECHILVSLSLNT